MAIGDDDDPQKDDSSIWIDNKSTSRRPKQVSVDHAFNDNHNSAAARDLRSYLDMEREQESLGGGGVLKDYISGFDAYKQQPELAKGCAGFNWSKVFRVWKKRSIKHLSPFPPFCLSNIIKSKSKSIAENPVLCNCHLYNFRSSLISFSLSELKNATNNFSKENLIGRGGFAQVYKGCLRDGQLIAVKQLNKGTPDERTSNFLSELGIIAHLSHPNTAKLIGCGVEGEMHLVFQLSPLGSLDSLLHGSNKNKLDWSKRYKIAVGIADGLLYLHEICQRRIIHRDIKAENILLTENFVPQICDFGLAKWLPEQCTHHSVSKFEGTFGYFAPEYLLHGIVDEKTDVYSFGVLLLEIITGRRALDNLHQSVVLWAKPLLDANNMKDLVDPSLGNNYDREQIDRIILTASLCVEKSPILRPRMSQVAILLRDDDFVLESAKECPGRSPLRTYSEELKMRRHI